MDNTNNEQIAQTAELRKANHKNSAWEEKFRDDPKEIAAWMKSWRESSSYNRKEHISPRFEASTFSSEQEIHDAYFDGKFSDERRDIELARFRTNLR